MDDECWLLTYNEESAAVGYWHTKEKNFHPEIRRSIPSNMAGNSGNRLERHLLSMQFHETTSIAVSWTDLLEVASQLVHITFRSTDQQHA